jgi:hypothetical protein
MRNSLRYVATADDVGAAGLPRLIRRTPILLMNTSYGKGASIL